MGKIADVRKTIEDIIVVIIRIIIAEIYCSKAGTISFNVLHFNTEG